MYLFVDLEATCEENPRMPREEMEVIEIGAVILGGDYQELGRFTTFVKPTVHPILTPFCLNLTTIRQEQVDSAPGFAEAAEKFGAWFKPFAPKLWSSWGFYDSRQFAQDCRRHGIPNPLGNLRHVNAKDEYARIRGGKARGLGGAIRELGLQFEGTHHRGVDDAVNVGRVVAQLFR